MPGKEDNQILWAAKRQIIPAYNAARTHHNYKNQKFTMRTLAEAILAIVGETISNSKAVVRMAVEDIPYNCFVCEKSTLALVKEKATQVEAEARQYKRIAKLTETRILVGWLIDGKVYLALFTYNQGNNRWVRSSLVHQVQGKQSLNVRHFDLIGMSAKVAVLGIIPEGDDSTQYLLRISILGDSLHEQGEATPISHQFATYISLCRLTDTKFMCAVWGYDWLNPETNNADVYKGQTFVSEYEMYPFITSGTARQVFMETKIAFFGGRQFLSATKKSPDALTMLAVDEHSVVLVRLPNYNAYVANSRISPHPTNAQVLIENEAITHQSPLLGGTKICATLLPPNFILSCVTAQDKVFCFIDKLDTNERILTTAILDGTPDNISVKCIGQNAFIFLATWEDSTSASSQLVKLQYNEANNTISELGKVTNLKLGGSTLEVLNYNSAVICGNRLVQGNNNGNVLKLVVQPCSISNGIAVAHRGDEIIGVSAIEAKAGDNVVFSGLAERYPEDD